MQAMFPEDFPFASDYSYFCEEYIIMCFLDFLHLHYVIFLILYIFVLINKMFKQF